MRPIAEAPGEGADNRAVRGVLAAFSATFVGIGLARFAYSPLIPALVQGGWFGANASVQLGAANLAGYFAGALLARPLAARIPGRHILRAAMALAAVSFLACAMQLPFAWFFFWRFGAGLAGGVLMAVAAPFVLPFVAAARRGRASGAIFTGIGFGAVASGTVIPLLLRAGLTWTWLTLGIVAVLLTAASWRAWPLSGPPRRAAAARRPPGLALRATYVAYALNGFALVPHIVFLVDFIARGLGRGIAAGSRYWVIYGLGAAAGPILAGAGADRIGFRRALHVVLIVEATFVAAPAVFHGPVPLALSAAVIGAMTPGIAAVVIGRVNTLVRADAAERQAAWSVATMCYAAGQAAGGYAFAALFAHTGSYAVLFGTGSAALLLALLIELAGGYFEKDRP